MSAELRGSDQPCVSRLFEQLYQLLEGGEEASVLPLSQQMAVVVPQVHCCVDNHPGLP